LAGGFIFLIEGFYMEKENNDIKHKKPNSVSLHRYVNSYGNVQNGDGIRYKVIDQGYDWYYISRGYYVPKIFCSF
jgi:hypothetical protein